MIAFHPKFDPGKRLLIYAEGALGRGRTKTAEGVIRYGKNPIVGIVDSQAGELGSRTPLAAGKDIPIFSSVAEALPSKPEALLVGLAPRGGHLPPEWKKDILFALEHGMDLISGLHDFMGDDPEISDAARRCGRDVWDVRRPDEGQIVGLGKAADVDAKVILTVGTDSALGKLTVAIEITRALTLKGKRALMVPTGQTGIMIAGFGVPVDRVIGDFMAGAIEDLIIECAEGYDYLLVEGQGSLIHPGYSGVTLSLLHGTAPSHMILCHKPSRKFVRDTSIPIPPLDRMVRLHEGLAGYVRGCKVIGIALNCSDLGREEALREVEAAEKVTGLPATDCIMFGCDKLAQAILSL